MPDSPRPSSDRSVHIRGSARSNVIQTGDHNTASIQYQQTTLPPPDQVDIRAEITALRELLAHLETSDRGKIANALSDAEDEVTKPEPDKDEVGKALARALDYAKKAEGFASVIAALKPHVTSVAAWLGSHWHTLLTVVGLVT
jgi:hypothetical protein